MSIALPIDAPEALGNYTLLKAHIAEKLDRSDLTAQIPNFIRLGECWLMDKIFHLLGEATATLSTVAGQDYVALPSDYRAARVAHITGSPPLTPVSPSELRGDWNTGTGQPQAYAIANGYFMELGPTPDAAYSIIFTYQAEFAPLSDSNPSNWLLQRRPDLYTYAALMQGEAHIVNDERVGLWKSALDEGVADLNAAGNRARISASPLRLRNPVCV